MHYLDHYKSISISQLINGKSRDLQKLRKYFNRTTTSASNVLLSIDVLLIIFILYSKDFLVIALLLLILLLSEFSFSSSVLILIMIPQSS